MNQEDKNKDVLIYENSDGDIKLDVFLEDETVWLSRAHMSVLSPY